MRNNTNYNQTEFLYNGDLERVPQRPSRLFENLIWLTTKDAAEYLGKTVNAIHLLVARKKIRARKFRNRLYFKRTELDYLIETSHFY